jgi:hypothetical protein
MSSREVGPASHYDFEVYVPVQITCYTLWQQRGPCEAVNMVLEAQRLLLCDVVVVGKKEAKRSPDRDACFDRVPMPNLLSIPFKKASELDIKQALHDHIRNTDTDAHPDAFKWDITHWATLRAEAVTPSVHVSQLDILLRCCPYF